ncbi:polysaccharide lyase [Streptomyces sp. NBC_00820]|uniref:heparin lyase I family protein n=1 Tax=Streptomyces sp. NBC_00820 TaxID=2975842 RepID=UPI002ED46DA2|nr:polysaccharide lyase [Streptomyces sp. NBC_00820]
MDYESGALDSGIPGLPTTHATAPDASAVVRPGHRSSYAVQHTVTLDDPGYFSDGAPRSESATDRLPDGTFHTGDTHRYEFSVLLKDWQPYRSGDSESGDIIFQGKYSGGQPPAFYLMTKRNAVAFRSPQMNRQTTVVPDFRPYVDQWMNFRVDARWTTDRTGWFEVSVELPGQSAYQLMASYDDVATWQPSSPADHGYLKWGLYRPSESLANGDVPTRTVQHDDIRVLGLS